MGSCFYSLHFAIANSITGSVLDRLQVSTRVGRVSVHGLRYSSAPSHTFVEFYTLVATSILVPDGARLLYLHDLRGGPEGGVVDVSEHALRVVGVRGVNRPLVLSNARVQIEA